MPIDVALVDLFRPYLLRGEATVWHAVLSTIYVESYETALSPDGIVIRGIARFSGNIDPPTFDPTTGTLRAGASNVEGHPRSQPDRRDPWLDITDTRVEFAMAIPRTAGAIIATGVAGIPGTNATFQPVNDVLNAWDAIPNDAPPSDYPGTGFVLDLVLSGIEFRPPFLLPAKMEADGLLVPDTSLSDVVFHLPKVKLRISQDSDAAANVDVSLVSLGVTGLDDPGDLSAAELISMEPAYAFIGSSQVVGFAFRSAFLDLADGYTPPEVLNQFGFDESWTGLYLPEIRIFFAPNGAEDFAVNAGVENFLIGLGDNSGITGDFDLAVINQGSGELSLSARFFDQSGVAIGISRLTDSTADVLLPATTRMVIDVVGGRAPYTINANFDGADNAGVVHDINVPLPKTITITATDTSAPQKSKTLTITAQLRELPAQQLPPGTTSPEGAILETTSISLAGAAQTEPRLRLVSDGQTDVVVALERPVPEPNTAWEIDDGDAGTSVTVTIPLSGGETKSIRAILPSESCSELTGYFRFDKPPKTDPITYSLNQGNTSAEQAVDPSSGSAWKPPARRFLAAYRQILARISPKTITIEGTASFDGDPQKAGYNYLLSQRRSQGLAELINADPSLTGFNVTHVPLLNAGAQPPAAWTRDWSTHTDPRESTHTDPREQRWKSTITGFSVNIPGPVIEGEVRRPTGPAPPTAPTTRDNPPDTPPPADWFRSARLKIRIVRDQFVALQLSGSIDFETAVEGSLRNQGGTEFPSIRGIGNNPADGIVDFLFLYQTDPASQTDEVKLYIGSDPNDRDGLIMTGQLPGQTLEAPNTGRNILGMTTVFTPLLAEIAPSNPADGGIAPIVLSGAVIALPAALAEIGFLNVERVVLFGGEAAFRRKGDLWETSFLFDVETAISADISLGGFRLLEIPRDTPLAVRYKAIGLKFGFPPGSGGAFELRPVFDQSRGYTIDVSGPGAIRIPDPLGQLLQVLGARIARTNPLTFEIDLGFAIDLGVISVDRARVRISLDPVGPPELTAFGAGLKVPGVLEGSGYMEMNNAGGAMEIKGGIDVSLVPIKMRIAAQIAVAQIPESDGGPATGVAITLEVELPVAIPLAQSGFGIYGFLGLFAMHYARDEDGITSLTPALSWLKDKAQGDPTNLQAWKPTVGSWAFGVGITLGTMGSPIIFNVKGMFLLELPGPRILLVVKANLLAMLPELKDKNAEGTFLCVIDLDFGRGTLTIGLSIDFSVKPIVEIKIPIEAYFNLESGGDWHVYLGTFPGNDSLGRPMPGPIRINILDVFNGAGYVMISGHGIPSYQPPGNVPALGSVNGVGLGVGLEVSIIWGNTSINLYLRVTAGFNAVLGFEPFYVGGVMYIRGELKLFIVSLSASASLVVQIGELSDGTEVSRIDGEVCGELDLFFFTLKGCVAFHLGEDEKILPPPPPLVKSTVLVSRSPAIAVGTGVDRGIDSKIGDAVSQSSQPPTGKMPVVPIDAIPVLTMAATPRDDGLTIFSEVPGGSPGAPADGFVKRGDFAYRFDLTEVRFETSDGSPAIMAGNAPSVWWTLNDPQDDNLTAQLSLLNWTPNPSPKALERSEFLDEIVTDRWGTICNEAAPAAPVFWAFHEQPLGPSETGWRLDGIAWPDPVDTQRSQDSDTNLHVHETWRTGNRDLDRKRGIIPAVIEGAKVNCAPVVNKEPRVERKRPGGFGADDIVIGSVFAGERFGLDDLFLRRDNLAVRDTLLGQPAVDEVSPVSPSGGAAARLTLNRETVSKTRFRDRLAVERARLAKATAGSVGTHRFECLPMESLRIDEAIRRLSIGEPVMRGAVFDMIGGLSSTEPVTLPPTTTARFNNPDGPFCDGRILASPLWDTGEPVVFGDLTQADAVKDELDQLDHAQGPLSDVIALESGAVTEGHLLMWVNRVHLNKETGRGRGLVLHFLDKSGVLLGVRPVRVTDRISIVGLPSRWSDLSGPWFEHVYRAVLYGQTRLKGREPVVVSFTPPAGTVRIDIGVLYKNRNESLKTEQLGRPFYVAAIEFTSLAEEDRSDYDESQIQRNRGVAESFLGPESGDIALMFPDKTYKVTTVTDVTIKDDTGTIQPGETQTETFWFRTDSEAPKRLDPWLLCSLPAQDEKHVFGHEDIKLVFATNDVDKLYESYGKELRARLKAASFRQVNEPGVQHPLPINGTTLDNVKAYALSPFEQVLVDVIKENGPCISIDEERIRHSSLEIPIPLDPFADYILDIEAVDIGAAPTVVGERVLRRAFSTGGFAQLVTFVEDFVGTLTEHRAVDPGVMQAIGVQFATRAPEGQEFDEALINAGLEPMQVPGSPRVVIFWQQTSLGDTPQPAAILLDASEPMHRARALPDEVTSDDPQPVKRWALTEQTWLTLEEAGTGDAIVDEIIFAPGRQRALITLNAGARGKVIHLELVRKAFAEPYLDGAAATDDRYRIVSETLMRAPWEEV